MCYLTPLLTHTRGSFSGLDLILLIFTAFCWRIWSSFSSILQTEQSSSDGSARTTGLTENVVALYILDEVNKYLLTYCRVQCSSVKLTDTDGQSEPSWEIKWSCYLWFQLFGHGVCGNIFSVLLKKQLVLLRSFCFLINVCKWSRYWLKLNYLHNIVDFSQ